MTIRIYCLCLVALQIFTIIKGVNSLPIDADEENIVYGEYADRNQFKHQVHLITNERVNCGGSIISENVVLTAAHCLPPNTETVQIIAGVTDVLDRERQVRYATQIAIHPEYRENVRMIKEEGEFIFDRLSVEEFSPDLALLYVDRPFQFNDAVSAIPLSRVSPDIYDQCIISGWGRDENPYSESRHLKWATVDIIPEQISDNLIISTKSNSRSGGFACFGDSGGPMTCNNELAGVSSSVGIPEGLNRKDCRNVVEQFYTSVPKYLDWIVDTSRKFTIPYPWNGVIEVLRE